MRLGDSRIDGIINFADDPVTSKYNDGFGHGSHVAGIAGGNGSQSFGSGDFYGGIAPLATLYNLRVFTNDGAGRVSNVLASIDWVLKNYKAKGIRVIGLGVGPAVGAMIPDGSGSFVKDERGAVVLSKLENSTLQELAATTNGVYADASTWVDLAQLIESTVATGQKGEFREKNQVHLAERFQWALAPAVLFLFWGFWREFPVRPRLRNVKLQASTTPPPTAIGLPRSDGSRSCSTEA